MKLTPAQTKMLEKLASGSQFAPGDSTLNALIRKGLVEIRKNENGMDRQHIVKANA